VHETKNVVCGEGGALVVNRQEDVERAGILYDKGTTRQPFKLELSDKYTWVDTGSSFGLSDVLAAYLTAQLEAQESIQARRKAIWDQYHRFLAPAAGRLPFTLP